MVIIVVIFVLLRPIFLLESNFSIGSLNLFQAAAIVFVCVLLLGLLGRLALRHSFVFDGLDICIILFILWNIVGLVAYPEKGSIAGWAKWNFPLIGYICIKHIIQTRQQFSLVFLFLLLGFVIPIVGSAALVATGGGLGMVDYWTKVSRYQGLFENIHMFGHAMSFYIMTLIIYMTLLRTDSQFAQKHPGKLIITFLIFIAIVAVYGMYMSLTRTVFVGLVVFGLVYCYYVNKRWLIYGACILFVGAIIMTPQLVLMFHNELEALAGGRSWEQTGSGRPVIWGNNIIQFLQLPLNRQLVGIGIGNIVPVFSHRSFDQFWNSHNDFLDVLMQTGYVGFSLFAVMLSLFYFHIRRLKGEARGIYLGLFWAVMVMNLLSNSYVNRFGLAQMLYVLLAYVDVSIRDARDAQGDTVDTKLKPIAAVGQSGGVKSNSR